jgi:hypothetical protein
VIPPVAHRFADVVGPGFDSAHYSVRTDLAPRELSGLKLLQAPEQAQMPSLQAAYKNEQTGTTIRIEGFSRHRNQSIATSKGQLRPIHLADTTYQPIEFHGLKAGFASPPNSELVAFVVNDLLFRVSAYDGPVESRREEALATAELLYRFVQGKLQGTLLTGCADSRSFNHRSACTTVELRQVQSARAAIGVQIQQQLH